VNTLDDEHRSYFMSRIGARPHPLSPRRKDRILATGEARAALEGRPVDNIVNRVTGEALTPYELSDLVRQYARLYADWVNNQLWIDALRGGRFPKRLKYLSAKEARSGRMEERIAKWRAFFAEFPQIEIVHEFRWAEWRWRN
jgi:hypothetical protein